MVRVITNARIMYATFVPYFPGAERYGIHKIEWVEKDEADE